MKAWIGKLEGWIGSYPAWIALSQLNAKTLRNPKEARVFPFFSRQTSKALSRLKYAARSLFTLLQVHMNFYLR